MSGRDKRRKALDIREDDVVKDDNYLMVEFRLNKPFTMNLSNVMVTTIVAVVVQKKVKLVQAKHRLHKK